MGEIMKKLFLIMAMVLVASVAWADYSVTVTWTHSVGPNLKNEKIFLDTVEQCDVLAASPATCNFVVTDLSGQEISAQAFNTQDIGSELYVMGTILAIPAPPTSGMFTITVIP